MTGHQQQRHYDENNKLKMKVEPQFGGGRAHTIKAEPVNPNRSNSFNNDPLSTIDEQQQQQQQQQQYNASGNKRQREWSPDVDTDSDDDDETAAVLPPSKQRRNIDRNNSTSTMVSPPDSRIEYMNGVIEPPNVFANGHIQQFTSTPPSDETVSATIATATASATSATTTTTTTTSADGGRGVARMQQPKSLHALADDSGSEYGNDIPDALDESDEGEEEDGDLNDTMDIHADAVLVDNAAQVLGNYRDYSQHRNGSIVRIAIKNFLTYYQVEFYPGPRLNMVVGPNGTGKSSIVCAIALGLGGAPNILGRAKEISEFVKTGENKAHIELEVMIRRKNPHSENGPDLMKTCVIRRSFTRDGNQSNWKIDGKHATMRQATDLMKKLGVQLDNLCQFLPQDRVSEFAQMTPPQLLRETQRAVGDDNMTNDHDNLIKMRSDERTLVQQLATEQEQVDSLIKRNERLKEEVERFNERKRLEETYQLLQARVPMAKAVEATIAVNQAKAVRKDAHERFLATKRAHEPAIKMVERVESEVRSLKQNRDQSVNRCQQVNGKISERIEGVKLLEEKNESISLQIDAVHRDADQRKETLANRKRAVDDLKRQMQEGAPDLSALPGIESQMHDVQATINANQRIINEKEGDLRSISHDAQRNTLSMSRLMNQLRDIEDVNNQRLEALKSFNIDTYQAVLWLRQNGDLFEKTVYEPPGLSVNPRDSKLADVIEAGMKADSQKMFICQTHNDYRTFTHHVIDTRKWRVNVTESSGKSLNSIRNAPEMIPVETIRQLGFDGYLIDMFEAPEVVKVYLCESNFLHSVPYSSRRIDSARVDSLKKIRAYFVMDTKFYITFSKYGRKSAIVDTSSVNRAKLLVGSVDVDRRELLVQQMDECRGREEELTRQVSQIEQGLIQYRVAVRDAKQNLSELSARRADINKSKVAFQQLQRRYETQLNEYERLRQQPVNSKQTIKKLQDSIKKLTLDRAKAMENVHNMMSKYHLELVASISSSMEFIQSTAKLELTKKLQEQRNSDLMAASEAFKQAEAELNEAKETLQQARREAKEITDGFSAELLARLHDFEPNKSLTELEALCDSVAAKLQLTYQGSAAVVEQYYARQRVIEEKQAAIEQRTAALDGLRVQMTDIRNRWEPRLEGLVKSISRFYSELFKGVGCAGEVAIEKHDDFDKWGINILVKFRDNERLQKLTAQRQSGGERSVSTIVYLTALQRLRSNTPFRIVDEINQGMDERNERLIHAQLVKVANQISSPQYFLITPKLLPNLPYHKLMKVLCVYNGDWQPEQFPIHSYIEAALEQQN
ncbi:P-loop containing nucleoside triphosphate hydrolase protein [Ramicandelaber brevisporus]|nr:P-loop containing nucleoside triphosphate hydrolase protein [Ramicandelaber brevisporus]